MENGVRRRSQFSLREMLIATFAVAAVAALIATNRPYSPTTFFTTVDEKATLMLVCADLGETLEFGGTIQGRGGTDAGGGQRESSLMINVPNSHRFRTTVMPEFQRRIEKMLEQSGCSIELRSEGKNTSLRELQEFGFGYRAGATRGMIRVFSLAHREDQTRLLILVDEH